MEEREVLQLIRRYNSILDSIQILKEHLARESYKITPSYSLTSGGGSWAHSKVEDFAINSMDTQKTIQELEETIRTVDEAVRKTSLTDVERAALVYTMDDMPLSFLAKQKGIYTSHIYKIRDSAIKKLTKTLNIAQNGAKTG